MKKIFKLISSIVAISMLVSMMSVFAVGEAAYTPSAKVDSNDDTVISTWFDIDSYSDLQAGDSVKLRVYMADKTIASDAAVNVKGPCMGFTYDADAFDVALDSEYNPQKTSEWSDEADDEITVRYQQNKSASKRTIGITNLVGVSVGAVQMWNDQDAYRLTAALPYCDFVITVKTGATDGNYDFCFNDAYCGYLTTGMKVKKVTLGEKLTVTIGSADPATPAPTATATPAPTATATPAPTATATPAPTATATPAPTATAIPAPTATAIPAPVVPTATSTPADTTETPAPADPTEAPSNDASISGIWTSGFDISYEENKFIYDADVKDGFASYAVQVKPTDIENATVVYAIGGIPVIGNIAKITLARGESKTVTAVVTAADGITSETYTFNLTLPKSVITDISNAIFMSGLECESVNGNNYQLAALNGYAKYVLKVKAASKYATVEYATLPDGPESTSPAYDFVGVEFSSDIFSAAIADDTTIRVVAKVTAEAEGVDPEYYVFRIVKTHNTNTKMKAAFVSGFAAVDVNAVNASLGADLNVLNGYSKYVFQFKTPTGAVATYEYADASANAAELTYATSNYISIANASIANGKAIFVKVVNNEVTSYYKFNIVK